MTTFEPGGPKRYAHQRRGLQKLINTGGVAALLFDPGMGKTAVILDYSSLLALKAPFQEARVLVICPLVAVDTWVQQAATFVSPQVGYWAEAISGSLLERAEALASRGGNPYPAPLGHRPTPPRGWILLRNEVLDERGTFEAQCLRCPKYKIAKRASTVDRWWQAHLDDRHPEYRPPAPWHAPRALHHDTAIALGWKQPRGSEGVLMSATRGPDGVEGPRLVLEVLNLDTFADRREVGHGTMADIMLGAIKRFAPDLLVIDESHKIKTASSNASMLMSRASKHVRRRALMTGTVAPAGPLDVFAQWRFLEPYAFGSVDKTGVQQMATLEDFKQRYVKLGGWAGKEIKGYYNLDHMQGIMSKNAVVARKGEALDLPPTTEVELHVQLSPAEALAYKEMKDQLVVQLAGGGTASVLNRLTQMLRLRQITSGHLPDDNGNLQVIGTSKVDLITSLVHDTLVGEKRVVIFALFSHEIKMLATLLAKDPGTEVMVIEGATGQQERQRMRARFGSDAPERMVMVAQVKTMSLAVNELVTASHAIFASLSQQRDDLEQAKARLDRTGQTRPVTFHFAIVPGTVDEIILKSHRERTSLEDALLRHIQDGGV